MTTWLLMRIIRYYHSGNYYHNNNIFHNNKLLPCGITYNNKLDELTSYYYVGLPGRAKSVKRFERSNGPDIALYKKLPFFYLLVLLTINWMHSKEMTFKNSFE